MVDALAEHDRLVHRIRAVQERRDPLGDELVPLREHDVALDATLPVLSHETLAEMVGTTRSRITHFMNKFRTMGLINYNGELTIRTELLTDLLLHD